MTFSDLYLPLFTILNLFFLLCHMNNCEKYFRNLRCCARLGNVLQGSYHSTVNGGYPLFHVFHFLVLYQAPGSLNSINQHLHPQTLC